MYHRKKMHIHFVGIGGIGMSGIAQILKNQGYVISGCDNDLQQQSVVDLLASGCTVFQGNNSHGCHDSSIDVVVYSTMIRLDHPELVAAQKRGIPTIRRALMLAELMRTKYSIAITGAHGKTTTTSLISHILIEAHMDPTVIIGGHLKNISANARWGTGDFLVAEADDSDRSFLHLHATIALVTNIDLEHLETYRDLDDIKDTYKQFLNNLPFYGCAILCTDDAHTRSILPLPHLKTVKYGFDDSADIYAHDVVLDADFSHFAVSLKNQKNPLGTIQFNMPGRHNVLNALGATALALHLEVPFALIAQALSTFKGIERRFSYNGSYRGASIFDDYGHHPEELRNTLLVARKRAKNKLILVFQPHRFTRTHKLWDWFVQMLIDSPIDALIITDIHAACEDPIAEITSANLVKALAQRNPRFELYYAPLDEHFASITRILETITEPDDLILLQGAGKINKLADLLQTKSTTLHSSMNTNKNKKNHVEESA